VAEGASLPKPGRGAVAADVQQPGGLLQRSLNAVNIEPEYGMATNMQPFGALVIFCAGCRLALGDSLCQFVDQFHTRLGDIPFITPFTFGEQGRLPMVSWRTAT
jgi:hypothetical protein